MSWRPGHGSQVTGHARCGFQGLSPSSDRPRPLPPAPHHGLRPPRPAHAREAKTLLPEQPPTAQRCLHPQTPRPRGGLLAPPVLMAPRGLGPGGCSPRRPEQQCGGWGPPARPSEAQGPGRPPYQFEDSGKRALDILALEALVSRFVVGSSAAVAEAGLLALGALRGKGTARSGPRGPRRGAPRRDLHGGHSGAATARAPAVKTHPGGTQTPLPHADGPRCRLTAVLPPQVRGFRALDSGTGLRVNDALGRPFPASDDLDLVGEGTAGAEGSRAAELPGRGSEGSAGGGGGGLLRGKRSWTRGSRAGGGSGEGRTGVSG